MEWNLSVNEQTGEVAVKAWAYIGTIRIQVKGKSLIEISGSLHQYWNDFHGRGKVNWNRFSYVNLCEAIRSFCRRLGIKPQFLPIKSVEYGLNLVNPPFEISETIDRFLHLYTRRFNEFTSDYGKLADLEHCWLKIYDKTKQADIPIQMMRIEFGICKMQYFQSRGIKIETLADLMRLESLQSLHRELLRKLRAATVFEPNTPTAGMTKEQRTFWKKHENPNIWKLLKNKKLSEANKMQKAIKAKFCTTSTNELIASLANDEFALLSGENVNDSRKSYRVEKRANGKILPSCDSLKNEQLTEFGQLADRKSYHLDERYDLQQPNVTTGRGQSDQVQPVEVSPTCKRCRMPIVIRRKVGAYCGPECKRRWESNVRRSRRKYGNAGGGLFDGLWPQH